MSPTVHLLVLELDRRRIALPAERVLRTVRAVAIAPLPQSPDGIEGVINFHGTLVPVFDLRRRLGLPSRGVSPHDHLVLLHGASRVVAVRVDQAVDLLAVSPADIGTPAGVSGCVSAVARLPDGLIVIQDLDRFLSPAEDGTLTSALAAASEDAGHVRSHCA